MDGLLWTEKYRPRRLEDVALDDGARRVLAAYVEAREIPHLLLSGPAGSGKTTVARILIDALDCRHLTLNASADRGIDVVRARVGAFVTAAFGVRWNVVFLDEADAMTSDAQTALRNLIEAHADRARFILTCNYPHKIIAPIQSRCQVISMGRPPLKERYRILAAVLSAEGIAADPAVLLGYAERFPDLRRMLMAAQRAHLAGGGAPLPPAVAQDRATGAEVLRLLETRNWTGLRRLASGADFDPTQALRDLFWAIPDDHARVGFVRHVVAKGLHETTYTPDPIILFLGVAAEVMEGLG